MAADTTVSLNFLGVDPPLLLIHVVAGRCVPYPQGHAWPGGHFSSLKCASHGPAYATGPVLDPSCRVAFAGKRGIKNRKSAGVLFFRRNPPLGIQLLLRGINISWTCKKKGRRSKPFACLEIFVPPLFLFLPLPPSPPLWVSLSAPSRLWGP